MHSYIHAGSITMPSPGRRRNAAEPADIVHLLKAAFPERLQKGTEFTRC